MLPAALPRVNPIAVDTRVLAFALLLSGVAGIICGLAPAVFSARANLEAGLREGGSRSSESAGRRFARGSLAAVEIALALVLLVGAGLFLRSFSRLASVHPGFEPQHVVKADISLPRFQYATPQQWSGFVDALLQRIHAQPGLEDSAAVVPIPLVQGNVNLGFEIVGAPPAASGDTRSADYASVSPGYFRVMAIPLMTGRLFDEHDIRSAAPVTLVSKALAEHYFPNQDPIGKRIAFSFPPDPGIPREIVGVVGDVRDVSLGQAPAAMMYVPFAQAPFWGAGIVARSRLTVSAAAGEIRAAVGKLDASLPVTDVASLPDLIDASVAEERFRTLLIGLFGAMALVLATTGVFGVISYSVSCRTTEIGIRSALGASRGAILRMVLRETLVLIVAGLAIGVPGALAAAHLMRHLLFGVSASDPATIALVVLLLGIVAMLAGVIPARRAMRVDPIVALRND